MNLKDNPIPKQIETQLKDLKLDYVDLILLNYSFSPLLEK
jgi:hypothetical protein